MGKAKDFSIIAIIFIIITIVVFLFINENNKVDKLAREEALMAFHKGEAGEENGINEDMLYNEDSDAEAPSIYRVYITGQVAQPGVYDIAEGQRIIDLIEMAGGALDDAGLDSINLAAYVVDAAHVIIPLLGEALLEEDEGEMAEEVTGLVNINTASLDRLTALPGIGPSIGQNIVNYREANGAFMHISEIKNVNRIGDSVYNQIRDLITVE